MRTKVSHHRGSAKHRSNYGMLHPPQVPYRKPPSIKTGRKPVEWSLICNSDMVLDKCFAFTKSGARAIFNVKFKKLWPTDKIVRAK